MMGLRRYLRPGSPRTLAAALFGGGLLTLLPALTACNLGDRETDLPSLIVGSNANVTFAAGQPSACPRADLLSLQPSATSAAFISVDVVLTDCDGSLRASGLGFELSFNNNVLTFVGCTEGSFFPSSQLAPMTPECVANGGTILGTIGLTPPNSVVMGGSGTKDVLELTFSIQQSGMSTPLAFTSIDLSSGTSLWLIDNTPTVTYYTLGAAGYAGGTITIN